MSTLRRSLRPPRLTLLLLAAGLWGATAAARDPEPPPSGRLQVTSDPPKATVLIDRQVRGETPLIIPNLPVGPHLVAVQKQGYADAIHSIELQNQDSLPIEFKLERSCALLLLQSSPPDAEITIEGVSRGRTPLLLSTLPFGTYRIRIVAPGFQPKEIEVQLPDRTPVRQMIDLLSNSAKLTVETDVSNATVRINGLECGPAPATVDRIPEGDCTVELRAEGYRPLTHKLKLAAGETQKISLPMTPIPASLTVVSLPDKARVYVNNELRGKTPLDLTDLSPGTYRVRVEMDGYEPNARDVEMSRGARKTEEFRMVSNAGRIELISEPAGATVFLDERKLGETKAKTDSATSISEVFAIDPVQTGEHEVRVVRKQHADFRQKVIIEQGKTTSVQARLVRRFVPDRLVVTTRGVEYRGMVESENSTQIRLETAPGIWKVIQAGDVKYQRNIREDGTLE
jgi:hypothetical protein